MPLCMLPWKELRSVSPQLQIQLGKVKILTGKVTTMVLTSVLESENLGDKRHPKQNNFPLSLAQSSIHFPLFFTPLKNCLLSIKLMVS